MADLYKCSTYEEWEKFVAEYFEYERAPGRETGFNTDYLTFYELLNHKYIWAPEFNKDNSVSIHPAWTKFGYLNFARKENKIICTIGSERFHIYASIETDIKDCKYKDTLMYKIITQPTMNIEKCIIHCDSHPIHGWLPSFYVGQEWTYEVAEYKRPYICNFALRGEKINFIDFTFFEYYWQENLYAISGKITKIIGVYLKDVRYKYMDAIAKGKGCLREIDNIDELGDDIKYFNGLSIKDFVVTVENCKLFAGFDLADSKPCEPWKAHTATYYGCSEDVFDDRDKMWAEIKAQQGKPWQNRTKKYLCRD